MAPASRSILEERNWIVGSHRLPVMKTLRSGLLILLLLTGCGLPFTHPAPDSGIDGIIVAWPSCAVEILASPCQQNRMQADVRVRTSGSTRTGPDGGSGQGEVIALTRSDTDGHFRVAVPPGSYVVEAIPPNGTTLTPKPVVVVVQPHEFAQVTVFLDTGIR